MNKVDLKDKAQISSGKTLKGKVVSVAMQKTIRVLVERKIKHPLFGKVVKKSKVYFVHTESDMHQIGEEVVIKETRPISKNKSWSVLS